MHVEDFQYMLQNIFFGVISYSKYFYKLFTIDKVVQNESEENELSFMKNTV